MLVKIGMSDLRISWGSVVGDTPEIQKICHIIQIAARTIRPVLIVGERGTGKELIARAIHSTSSRRQLPFTTLDCAHLQARDLESHLFNPSGTTSPSNAGTLFLDRLLDLSIEQQGTLLRGVQQGESSDYSSAKEQVRLIGATTGDIQTAVAQGKFRRDLYFRLNALSLRVPPLRERRRDIPLLAANVVSQFSVAAERECKFSDDAITAMINYDWPGNVRELEDCAERAFLSSIGSTITPLDLPASVRSARGHSAIQIPTDQVVPLSELERLSIRQALASVRGDKRLAAKLLGIGKTTLYRKLREYESRS
jgi:DNA-binding NtrC family response regulator